MIEMASVREVKLFPEEIRIAKRDMLDFVLREIIKVENYWKFRYRDIVGHGIGVSYNATMDILEAEEGLVIVWRLKVLIPKESWVQLARLRKQRRFRLPKPHPVIRQRYREMEEIAEEVTREVEEDIAVEEEGGGGIEILERGVSRVEGTTVGEGDSHNSPRRGVQPDGENLQGA